ncbi:MAG: tetratricopeptide repeat protein, partial [Pirellula sp.]
MQFLYNSASEVSKGFPPVSVVTDELLQANAIYSETIELFEKLKHSKTCCRCEKHRPVKVAPVVFLEEHFACSFPLPVCDHCSRTSPFVPSTNPSVWYIPLAGIVLALFAFGALASKSWELVGLSIALLGVMLYLQRVYAGKPPNSQLRDAQTREMILKSPFFSKFLKAYPNGQLFWQTSTNPEPWGTDTERTWFQSSLIAFDRGYILSDLHGLNEEDGSLAICHAVFEYIDTAFHKELKALVNSPVACQALIQFFPGRKRIIQTQVLPPVQAAETPGPMGNPGPIGNPEQLDSKDLEKTLQAMPDFPVRAPVILVYRSCNLQGTNSFRELSLPDAHPDYQRYVKALNGPEETASPETASPQDHGFGSSQEQGGRFDTTTAASSDDSAYAAKMMSLPENNIRIEDMEVWRKAIDQGRRLEVTIPELLASTGELDQALNRWEEILKKSPEDRELIFGYARFLQRHGRLEKAASICQGLIKLPDAGSDWFGFLAHLQHSMGFPEEAMKTIQSAPDSPKSEEFHFVAASISEELQDIPQAIMELEKALEINPYHGNSLLLRAKLLMIQGRNHAALKDVDEFLENEGPNLRAIQLKAYIIDRLQGIEKSIDYLSSCIEKYGKHPILNGLRADAYKESGKFTLALEDIDWVIENQPDLAVARQQRLEIQLENGDAQAAIADAQVLIEQGVDTPTLLSDYGYARFLNEEYEQAVELLQRAVGIDQSNLSARYRLSQAYSKLGRIEDAIAELSAILEVDSEHAVPFVVRGYHYMMVGQHEEAAKDFQKALELEPKELQAMRGRALVLEIQGDRKQALKTLDEALKLDPTNEECLLDRSRMAMSGYDLKAAEKDLDQVIQSS